MKKYQITGIHPVLNVIRIYAIYAPEDEVDLYIQRAEADGWTDVKRHNQPQPELFPDPAESGSSESETSPKSSKSSSTASAGASRASATRSSASQRKARRRG